MIRVFALLAVLVTACGPVTSFQAPSPVQSAPTSAPIFVRQLPGEGPPAKYGSTPAYDACSLLSVDGLGQLGLRLRPHSTLMHDYLDGDVPADVAVEQDVIAAVSFCEYTLTNNGRVNLHVHQTPHLAPRHLLDMTQRHFEDTTARQERGLKISVTKDQGWWWFYLARPDLLIVGGVEEQDANAQSVATRLSSQVAELAARGPTAPVRHVYDAPYADVRPVCEIASAAAFTRSHPARSAAIVHAQYYLSAVEHPILRGNGTSRQTVTSCYRTNVVPEGVHNKREHRHIDVSFSMWDKEEAATGGNAYSCDPADDHPFAPPVAVSPSIGTGNTCMSSLNNNWALTFQHRKVNVSVTTGDLEQSAAEERRAQLMPAAQEVAAALAK